MRSCVLILVVLLLSAPSLRAEENARPVKSRPTSPATGTQQEKQPKPNASITEGSPSQPAEPVTSVSQLTTSAKHDGSQNEPQDTCIWGIGVLWDWWQTVPKGTVPDWGLLLVAIITARYAIRSLRAIETQATAALKTAESLVTTERAYIFGKVNGSHINTHGNGGITIAGEIEFWNYGKTPAIPIRCQWAGQETSIVPQALGHADQNVPYWHEGITIAVGAALSTPLVLSITQERLADLRTGGRKLYVWGVLEYRDVFNNEHETGFCWEHTPNGTRIFECTRDSPLNRRT